MSYLLAINAREPVTHQHYAAQSVRDHFKLAHYTL